VRESGYVLNVKADLIAAQPRDHLDSEVDVCELIIDGPCRGHSFGLPPLVQIITMGIRRQHSQSHDLVLLPPWYGNAKKNLPLHFKESACCFLLVIRSCYTNHSSPEGGSTDCGGSDGSRRRRRGQGCLSMPLAASVVVVVVTKVHPTTSLSAL